MLVQIIQTKIILIKYAFKHKTAFKAIECYSVLVPTTYNERICLYGFIYGQQKEKKRYYDVTVLYTQVHR